MYDIFSAQYIILREKCTNRKIVLKELSQNKHFHTTTTEVTEGPAANTQKLHSQPLSVPSSPLPQRQPLSWLLWILKTIRNNYYTLPIRTCTQVPSSLSPLNRLTCFAFVWLLQQDQFPHQHILLLPEVNRTAWHGSCCISSAPSTTLWGSLRDLWKELLPTNVQREQFPGWVGQAALSGPLIFSASWYSRPCVISSLKTRWPNDLLLLNRMLQK